MKHCVVLSLNLLCAGISFIMKEACGKIQISRTPLSTYRSNSIPRFFSISSSRLYSSKNFTAILSSSYSFFPLISIIFSRCTSWRMVSKRNNCQWSRCWISSIHSNSGKSFVPYSLVKTHSYWLILKVDPLLQSLYSQPGQYVKIKIGKLFLHTVIGTLQ